MVFSTQITTPGVLGIATRQRPEVYIALVLVMGMSEDEEAILIEGQCRNPRNNRPCCCMWIHHC